MAINKATLSKEIDGKHEYIYPKTSADMVEYNNAQSVKDKLDEVAKNATDISTKVSTNTTDISKLKSELSSLDSKVIPIGQHYTPVADTKSDLTASASGAEAEWSIDVVKGITINRDSKGHVTGINVTSGKIPANPNTDTKYTAGTGLSLSTSNQFSLAASGVTAGSAGPTAAVTGSNGVKVAIPRLTVDTYGRVTSLSSYELTNVDNDTTYSVMGKATASAGGASGLVPASAAGDQTKFLRADGTWVVPTNTTYSAMTAATASAAGKTGLVPAPAAGKQDSFLRGDGTWVVPTDTNTAKASSTASIGSASGWSAGTLPTLGTAITAHNISSWNAGTLPALSLSKGVLSVTKGTAPTLSYTEKTIPNVTAVGTLPSLTVTNTTVVTGVST